MERKFPHLSSPIQIGNVVFRNRMCSAPMGGTDITNEGAIGPGSKAFYELRAKGGAAAVTVSECMVASADGWFPGISSGSVDSGIPSQLHVCGGCNSSSWRDSQSGAFPFRYVRGYLYGG